MTSVTDHIRRTARATEGARRATGVALVVILARSPHCVVVLQGSNPILLSLLFHRWLLSGSAIDAELKLSLSRTWFQRIVHDLVAHLPVYDVVELIN